jgi:flagellar FliL protein
MLKPILIATVVSVVILTECLFAYLLIPSTSDLQAWAQTKQDGASPAEAKQATTDAPAASAPAASAHGEGAHGKSAHGETAHGASDSHGSAASEAGHGAGDGHDHEVDLGKFNVVVHQPAADVTLRINFHLIGTVTDKEHHEFTELLAKNQHRLRDHVISEIRNAQGADLNDPGLALLKRRILATSNELLGKPILQTIVFSDFSFIEQ